MTYVRVSGPVFDGRAEVIIRAASEEAERVIAEHAYELIQTEFSRVLRQPTGYYQSRVHAQQDDGGWRVHDSGVVYGPWLEGVGSRNRTTRFKGYSTFRRMTQVVQARANDLAENVIARHVGRLG